MTAQGPEVPVRVVVVADEVVGSQVEAAMPFREEEVAFRAVAVGFPGVVEAAAAPTVDGPPGRPCRWEWP